MPSELNEPSSNLCSLVIWSYLSYKSYFSLTDIGAGTIDDFLIKWLTSTLVVKVL
jgi:hypothetical protein